jgi:hypothetical protein
MEKMVSESLCNDLVLKTALELGTAEKEILYLREMVLEAFSQACGIYSGAGKHQYDHMCISTWEHAQQKLIGWGLVSEEECRRI